MTVPPVPPVPATPPVSDTSQSPDGGGQPPDDGAGRVRTEVGHSLFGLVRPPGPRVTTCVLIVALLVAVICWYFGADVWHSILLGGVLTTVGLIALVGVADLDQSNTGWRGGGRPNRDGARSEVAHLSWSLRGSYGRVDRSAVWRVRQLARHRLALHQLDLHDPADLRRIEQLIGRSANAVLVRGERRPPLLRSLLHCLDVLDTLDHTRPAAPPSRSRRRTPIWIPHRLRRARER
jgi:hypothetical protein